MIARGARIIYRTLQGELVDPILDIEQVSKRYGDFLAVDELSFQVPRGSIFGLLAALIVYGRTVGASLMTRQLWQWAIVLGVLGFLLPGVDNLAHLGGFAAGWVAATAFRGGLGRREGRSVTFLALGLLLATVLGFLINLGQFLGFFLR